MNKQEIFDKVATHLLTQGKQSRLNPEDTRGICAYRSKDGSKCAAGCLIPDDVYDPRMEGNLITTLIGGVWLGDELLNFDLPSFFGKHAGFIRSLQMTHDAFMPPDWFDELVATAGANNLSTDTLIAVAARVTGERLDA